MRDQVLNNENEEYNAEAIVDFIEDRLDIGEDEVIPALVAALKEFTNRLEGRDYDVACAWVESELEDM